MAPRHRPIWVRASAWGATRRCSSRPKTRRPRGPLLTAAVRRLTDGRFVRVSVGTTGDAAQRRGDGADRDPGKGEDDDDDRDDAQDLDPELVKGRHSSSEQEAIG